MYTHIKDAFSSLPPPNQKAFTLQSLKESIFGKSHNLKGRTVTVESHSILSVENIHKFWIVMGCWATYNFFDAGLARFFALETLSHGTGPFGYIGISLYGADPAYGGGNKGSSYLDHHIKASKQRFHVFKDSAFLPNNLFENHLLNIIIIDSGMLNKILPRGHALLSGMASFRYSDVSPLSNLAQEAIGAISGLLTPTLKFRFTPEAILNCNKDCRFENDSHYNGLAYHTAAPINPSHLGILGSLTQGISSGMVKRMYANSEKVFLGLALLSVSYVMGLATYRAFNDFKANQESDSSKIQPLKNVKLLATISCGVTLAVTTLFLNNVLLAIALSGVATLGIILAKRHVDKLITTPQCDVPPQSIFIKSCWAAAAITAIFFNTL